MDRRWQKSYPGCVSCVVSWLSWDKLAHFHHIKIHQTPRKTWLLWLIDSTNNSRSAHISIWSRDSFPCRRFVSFCFWPLHFHINLYEQTVYIFSAHLSIGSCRGKPPRQCNSRCCPSRSGTTHARIRRPLHSRPGILNTPLPCSWRGAVWFSVELSVSSTKWSEHWRIRLVPL